MRGSGVRVTQAAPVPHPRNCFDRPVLGSTGNSVGLVVFNTKFFAALFVVASAELLSGCSRLAALVEQQNRQRCNDSSPDVKIAACTAVIRSGVETGASLAASFNNRGIGYYDEGQYDLAIQDYSQAIRLKPLAAIYNNRGNAYRDQRYYDLAIQDYDQAIRMKPDLAIAFNNRGVAYLREGQYDLAIRDFDATIRLKPDYASAYANRGSAYDDKGQYALAIQDLDRAIGLTPDDAAALNNRCYARAEAGHGIIPALLDCNESLLLRPGEPATLDSRGFVYLHLGRFDDAIRDYNAALSKDARVASSLYGRGFARLREGDKTGGAADIAAAEKVDPGIAKKFAGYGLAP